MSERTFSSNDGVALRVGHIQTACSAMGWALDTLAAAEHSIPIDNKRFEVIAGMGFILEVMSKELGEVYGVLSER